MVRYTQLPNPPVDPDAEMDAAFDNSDDEGEDTVNPNKSVNQPLLRRAGDRARPSTPPLNNQSTSALATASTYNFEIDYDIPPPGSPPRPSALALPNAYGNNNGQLPTRAPIKHNPSRPSIFRRAINAIRPSQPITGAVGGGMRNDGVFGNVVAKPGGAAPRIGEEESDGPYWAPELVQKDAPPSYATAQADAVPGYWENTILAPSDPSQGGDIIIDGLPIGSLFAFLWNALFSMSFQFVGFLLTHILAGSHAARFGSRAGLGVTLIQYGFYIRQKPGSDYENDHFWPIGEDPTDPSSQGSAAATATRLLRRALGSLSSDMDSSMGHHTGMNSSTATATATTEVGGAGDWIAFFLMVLGWFIFLSSFLGYWRVKRIERGIRGSVSQSTAPQQHEDREQLAQLVQQFERMFAERRAYRDALRRGLGLGVRHEEEDEIPDLETGSGPWTHRPLTFRS